MARDDVDGIPTVEVTVYYRYYTISRASIAGNALSYSVNVPAHATGHASRSLIRQMDIDGVEILAARRSASVASAEAGPTVLTIENIVIDADCDSIQVWLDKENATSCHFQLPCLIEGATITAFRTPKYKVDGPAESSTATSVAYVSTTGDDTNDGSYYFPLATVEAAIDAMSGNGIVVIRGGDYSESVSIAAGRNLSIRAFPQERVRFLMGTEITGVSKTGGYTKVYSGALAVAPTVHIFEHETPEGEISDAERHSLNGGRSHRLFSTRLWPVASIAEVDSATAPSWYHDGSGTIYFSASDGGDATTNTYYSPSSVDGFGSGISATNIEIQGIEVWYGAYGFRMSDCGSYTLRDVIAFGSGQSGIVGSKSTGTEIRCESAASGTDGVNTHGQTTTAEATTRNSTYVKIDLWCHDNYDDGTSIHERCRETIIGGLFEYNGDRGVVPAFGAHSTVYNAVARFNGQNTPSDTITGEGFAVVGDPVAGEGGDGTQMECHGCISEGNNYGFASHAATGVVRAYGCRSIGNAIAGYSADYGTTYVYDCLESGSGAAKSETNSGSVTVSNGTLVT